jgi:superkiller protein 3
MVLAMVVSACKLADDVATTTQGQLLAGDGHAQAGLDLYRTGRCEQAIAELRQAAAAPLVTVEKKVVLTHLGVCLENEGNLSEAVTAHQRAIDLDPGYSKAWGYLGIARRKQGRMKDARECYDRAVVLDPRNHEALSSLGTWFILENQPQEAIAVLEQAIAIDGSYPTPHANLAVAYAHLRRLGDARRSVEKAARLGYPEEKLVTLRARVTALGEE